MKISHFKIAALVLTASVWMTTHPAHADAVGSAQAQVGTQLTLTHSAIDQLLERVRENGVQIGGLNQADYEVKSKKFHGLIKEASDVFEKGLTDPEKGILVQAQAMIARYNAIYESTQYSDALKASLLTTQRSYLSGFSNTLAEVYGKNLKALFNAAGYDLFDSDGRITDGKGIYPFLKMGCYSQSCVSSSAFDEVNYISLVKSLFNNPIELKMEDGLKFSINPINDVSSNFSSFGFDDVFGYAVRGISSTANFPDDFKKLPIGFAQSDFVWADLIVQRSLKISKLDEDLSKVKDLKGGSLDKFDQDLRDICSVAKAHPEFENRIGGCLDEENIEWLTSNQKSRHSHDYYNDSGKIDKWTANMTKENAKIAAEFHWPSN